MALTTLQFWQQQYLIHQAGQTAGQKDLGTAQALQKTATTQLAANLKALDLGDANIKAQRAQLAVITVPADASALIVKITTAVIQQRGLQGRVLDDQAALADATAQADATVATLARASARLAMVGAAIARAGVDAQQRAALKSAIAAPPLASIKADATALRAGTTASHAATRIGKNFPTALLTIAGKRRDTRSGRLVDLQTGLALALDAQANGQASDAGLAGAVSQKALVLQQAQAALAETVAVSLTRYASAKSVLQKLEAIELDATGATPDVLSAAEKSQLAALGALGAAAEPGAETLDADLQAVFDAQDALDAQILSQIGSNVDLLATDATVAAKRAAISAAQSAFDGALASFAAANKADLDQWQAVVPDPAWQFLLAYLDGLAALNQLAVLDLPALATVMDNAETDYTSALAVAEQALRRADARTDAITLSQARLAAAQAALSSRAPSAIRGDTY